VDATAHYRNLATLGRAEFLAGAAPAFLVLARAPDAADDEGVATTTAPREQLTLFPLLKKPGASFPDRITIGRTSNNDVAIVDHSVSRLHAYVKLDGDRWVVADAGSKHGSWLAGAALTARKERPIASKARLRLGDVDLTFYLAGDLYIALGGANG
jgi:pSer/pThr/pTyr-binding forkhead associated (FHA) protein